MEKPNMLPGVFTAVLVSNDPRHLVTKAQAAGKGVQIPFLSYSTPGDLISLFTLLFSNYAEILISIDCDDVV